MKIRKVTRMIMTAACLGCTLVAAASSGSGLSLAAEEETPKQIIALQISKQGYACKNPEKATRDVERSKPDQAVWVLVCESGTYRVRLVPDMAAHVERVE